MKLLPAALLIASCAAASAVSDQPNVLFIISDDLSASALSCYGNEQCQTPGLDRLAARGVRFTRAYCQYPVCGPSRAALMSGMYPQSLGVLGNGSAGRFTELLGDRPSLSQLFIEHGYHSARVSKIYHMRVPGDITAGVDGPDHAASWTERFNCQGPEWMTPGVSALYSNETLRREPDEHYGLGFGTAFFAVEADPDGVRQPDAQAVDRAIEIMKARRSEPFFLAVGLVRPHVPLVAPAPHFEPYPADEMLLAPRQPDDWEDIPPAGISTYNSRSRGLTEAHRQRGVLRAYYASVSFMDSQVARLLDALEELQLTDDTLIVFSSDHGYHLGEHDFWQKLSLHEESARIPLLIAGPGIAPAVTDSLAEQIDLYPTLAELAGLPVPVHCQGRSLGPVLADPGLSVRDGAYSHRSGAHLLRTDRWAYIDYGAGEVELYDMRDDPYQFTNLAREEEFAPALAELSAQLESRLATMR